MNIIELLAELNRLKAQLHELTHRVYGVQIGTVTDNRDPLNLRRIKVAPQSKGGVHTSEWLLHCNPDPGRDAPIPRVGSTAFYQFLDGDPHDGIWLGVAHNDTNPPDPLQTDPTIDSAVEIPGNDRRTIAGESISEVNGAREDSVSKSFTLKVNDEFNASIQNEITITSIAGMVTISGAQGVRLEDGSGAFVEISGGAVRLGNAAGQDWQLGGGTGSAWDWDIGGGSVNVANATDFKINGKSVAVVGARDSRNDALVNRGY